MGRSWLAFQNRLAQRSHDTQHSFKSDRYFWGRSSRPKSYTRDFLGQTIGHYLAGLLGGWGWRSYLLLSHLYYCLSGWRCRKDQHPPQAGHACKCPSAFPDRCFHSEASLLGVRAEALGSTLTQSLSISSPSCVPQSTAPHTGWEPLIQSILHLCFTHLTLAWWLSVGKRELWGASPSFLLPACVAAMSP